MEIKCPYTARNGLRKDACQRKDFFLAIDPATDAMQIKESHIHYAQIQGQLMLTGADFCEFIVYTWSEDFFVQRIFPDQMYIDDLLHTVDFTMTMD